MPHKVDFALWSPQAGSNPKLILDRAQLAERHGFHSIWLVDHFWTLGLTDADMPEATAMMAAIAATTERLRIGTLVLCQSFRNPALLAKTLTTIDHISNGRLEIGMGAGWMEPEYKAYNYDFPSMGRRLRELSETLQILKLMFTEKRATFEGRYYSVKDAPNNPKPVQKPHPPILVGGAGEKVLLKMVAKYADRWNCPAGYRDFAHTFGVLKEHCKTVGRDLAEITISEQVMVCLGANQAEADRQWEMVKSRRPFSFTAIKGTPEQVVAQIRERVGWGITMFTMMFSDMAQPATLELFAREVMPAFA